MRTAIILALATATFAFGAGAALAGPERSGPAARDFSYVDVSSDDGGNGAAVTTAAPGGASSIDYRVPDPMPDWRWATRGEWRRHHSLPPTGSAAIPLT